MNLWKRFPPKKEIQLLVSNRVLLKMSSHKDSCLSPKTCNNHAIYLFSVPNW